jgi:acetyltransferase-like isoleucine patch superfamily enzyme
MMYQDDANIGQHVDISEHVSYNNVKTGNNGKIRHFSILFGTKDHPLTIGNDFFIGVQCYLNGAAGITMGDRVTLAHGVMIFSDSGPNTSPWLQQHYPITAKPVTIGNDVWIGARAMILPGVTIGDKCVIGAGALVKEDVPPNSVVAGNPAKVIKTLAD